MVAVQRGRQEVAWEVTGKAPVSGGPCAGRAGARASLPAAAVPGRTRGRPSGPNEREAQGLPASPAQLHLPLILLPFEKQYVALLYLLNVRGELSSALGQVPGRLLLLHAPSTQSHVPEPSRALLARHRPGPPGGLLCCKSEDSRRSALKTDGHCFLEALCVKVNLLRRRRWSQTSWSQGPFVAQMSPRAPRSACAGSLCLPAHGCRVRSLRSLQHFLLHLKMKALFLLKSSARSTFMCEVPGTASVTFWQSSGVRPDGRRPHSCVCCRCYPSAVCWLLLQFMKTVQRLRGCTYKRKENFPVIVDILFDVTPKLLKGIWSVECEILSVLFKYLSLKIVPSVHPFLPTNS